MPAPDPAAPTVSVIGQDPLAGFTADGITLERLLRDGVQSRTYVGRRGDGLAVQVWIAGDHLGRDAAFLERLRQEAGHLANLRHVHVEVCLGHRTWTGPDGRSLAVLVEEASAGVTLGDLARHEALPVRDVLRLFHQVAAGLGAAHRMGIVHGDITPEAVLVTAGGMAKLRSFALGVSGYIAERADRSLIGTPDCMAPEVGRGQQPSSLSDLYAIGASLFTVLTGDAPYPAVTALETIHLHATVPTPDLAASHAEFAALAPLIGRLMAKDPAQRWIDLDDLARDLLVLSGQIPGELRCRAWSGRRPQPLASLVQSALAGRQEQPASLSPPPAPPPVRERSTGGTTTISRNSSEVFRNPELFKPSGLTPAGGLPVLPLAPGSEPPPRLQPRIGEGAAPYPSSPLSSPPRSPSYLSRLAALPTSPVSTPPVTTTVTLRRPRRWIARLLLLVVAVAAGWAIVVSVGPAPSEAPRVVEVTRPVERQRPGGDQVSIRVAEIVELGMRDPSSALARAAELRRTHPQADLALLPVALRLEVEGPASGAFRVMQNGTPVAMTNGSLCRMRGQPLSLRITAEGFRPVEIEVPSSPADELIQTVVMLNEPRWAMAPFAPTWVRLLPAGSDVLLASDRKVVLISANDGVERRRLDSGSSPLLPENPVWASVLSLKDGRIRLGVVGGLCVAAAFPGLEAATEVHRGTASVLALKELPLTLRLGEDGMFLVERDGPGFVLAADNRVRRLWSRPLKSAMTPWLAGHGDQLLVVGERQVQRFSQEGEETASWPLPAPRSAEPLTVGAAGVLLPTLDGLFHLEVDLRRVAGVAGPVGGVVEGGGLVVAANGRGLMAWRIAEGGLEPAWVRPDLIPADRRLVHLSIGGDQVVAVDDVGVMRVFARGDGAPVRILRSGSPLLAPPLVVGGMIVVVLAPGVVAAF